MKRFYVQVSVPGSNLPDVLFWSMEGALRELVYKYQFPETWNAAERETEVARLQAAAESLSGDIPKDFLFFLLEDMTVLEAEEKQARELESQAREVKKRKDREAAALRAPQNFRADFGNVCAMERVGSFSRSGAVDGLW